MAQFTLGENSAVTAINPDGVNTITLINLALEDEGNPGANNINYYNAYTAIYNEMVAWNNAHPNDQINAGTMYWFSEAGNVNRHDFLPSDTGAYIWEYTRAAAKSEETVTLTDGDIQAASDAIALGIVGRLDDNSFVFSDADTPEGFAPKQMVGLDATAGITSLQQVDGDLDFAIWGGTLFARTLLQDPDYFAEKGVSLEPNSRHGKAILDGLFAGAEAVRQADGDIAQAINLDIPAIYSVLPTEQKVAVAAGAALAYSLAPTLTALGALAAGATYIWNAKTKGFLTLSNVGDTTPGNVHVYDPDTNAWLAFVEGDAGEGMLTLKDGQTLEIGGTADLMLVDIQRGTSGSTAEALVSFLDEMGVGDYDTLAELNQFNLDDLYPEGTPFTATGEVVALSYSEANFVIETLHQWGATVTGEDFVTIQTGVDEFNNPVYGQVVPTNILVASGDITDHVITDVPNLQVSGDVAMTAAQFAGQFDSITGSNFTLNAATDGTFDASSITISGLHRLVATYWSGTILIGNNENGQILQASLLGDDTLQAGNGTGAVLIAGLGASQMIGGTGGNHFIATNTEVVLGADHLSAPGNGLAPGSEIDGTNGTGDTLHAAGDISQATISDIETLHAWGEDITLTAGQFNDFDTIEGGNVLYAATGGTYDWSEQEDATFSEAHALSSAGTTLKANSQDAQILVASAYGNDTLIALEGNGHVLDAGDSTGDVTLTGGDGDNLQVQAGYGVNTITLGTGANNGVSAEHGLAAGSSVAFSNSSDSSLFTQGDISGATLTGVHTLGGIGDITLNATQLAGVSAIINSKTPTSELVLKAASAGTYSLAGKSISGGVGLNGSSGNDTLTGSSGVNTINGNGGNDTIRGGQGADTINAGDGDDSIQIFSGEVPSGESIDGGNGTDRLTVGNNNMNPSAMAVANMEELYLNSGVTNLTVSGSQLADFETITHANGGGQAFTLNAAAAGAFSLAGKAITGVATLNGTSGADTLTGSANADTVNGNAGNDIIEGGAGNDTLNGGNDTDTLTCANAGSAVTVDLSNGSAQNTGGAGTDTISNFENLTGSAYNDTLTGTSSANVILGGDGNDTITAGAGADTIDGGIGTNTLTGGTGNDTYNLERTYGASDIVENDSTGSNTDVLQLGADIAPDQMWFRQSGNDLLINVIGTDAQMTVKDWYLGSDYQVEEIKTAGAADTLSNSNVQNLVNAMSSLSMPETTTLSTEYHTALDSTIAANWA
jgi:hypothetical protein